MKRLLIILLVLVLALTLTAAALARGGGGGRSGGGGFGGGSKSGGGSKCCSGGSKSGGSSSSRPSVSKPSTGARQQRVPVTKLIPPAPPRVVRTGTTGSSTGPLRVPSGRSYSRDRAYIIRNPQYANPYGGISYYGYSGSPFFYMWLFSMMDNDRSNNALPPESEKEISPALLSYFRVIEAMDQVAAGR